VSAGTTLALITARLTSTRLPGKALRPIRSRPLVGHLLDRLRLGSRIDDVVMCTSARAEDDPLERWAHEEGIPCFRGHPDDVLVRIRDAASTLGCERAFVCGADNPFTDPVHMDALLDLLERRHYDYVETNGLPWGAYGWAVTTQALERACELKDTTRTEAWTGYFTQTGRFRFGIVDADTSVRWPELRLTVDTPEDFELTGKIFDELDRPGAPFSLIDIVKLCREKPELLAVNASVQQRSRPPIQLRTELQAAEGVGS